MKVRIIISIIIFVIMIMALKGTTIGIDRIPLSELEWGFEKLYIWMLIILSAAIFATIPFIPIILNNLFREFGEIN